MSDFVAAIIASLWAGILTSVSPCPLVTNIAAISFVAKQVDSPLKVCISGFLYTLGRILAYMVLVYILLSAFTATPALSHFLQKNMNKMLGPILFFVGLTLIGLLPLKFNFSIGGIEMQQKAKQLGIWAAFPLGAIFALSFCPTSAALFFGAMFPLAIKYQTGLFIPISYGLGTALPVIAFAILIAFSTNAISKVFDNVIMFEKWARKVTGVIFICAGIHLVLGHWFAITFI